MSRRHFDQVTVLSLSSFRRCQHFENRLKGCKTVFENEPFQCSTESIRTKREKKRKGKKKKSQKNQMDLVINQGMTFLEFNLKWTVIARSRRSSYGGWNPKVDGRMGST